MNQQSIGLIEVYENKTAKNGTNYVLLRINGIVLSDFKKLSQDLKVGDKVSFTYYSKGQFKNLESVQKLESANEESIKVVEEKLVINGEGGGVSSFSPPPTFAYSAPFLGMCANQALEIVLRVDGDFFEEKYRAYFKRLCKINTEIQEEIKNE